MKHFFSAFCLFITSSFFGQFNTLSYPVKDKKGYLQQSFSVSKIEKKDTLKSKKKKRFTTKRDLKKELDSLKNLIIELGEKKTDKNINLKKMEDFYTKSTYFRYM